VVHGSQLYGIEGEVAARIEAGDEAAIAELEVFAPPPRLRPALDDLEPPRSPHALSLNLAQACNLRCRYCYADEGRFHGAARLMPEEVALSAIDRLLAESARGERVTVGFIGGEPFLNRAVLYRAVAHARDRAAARGVRVGFSVTTNGTLLREEDVALLRENAFAVSVGLDGNAAVHDRHRPASDGGGSHARALAALAPLLRDPGRARLAARATVTRDDLRVAERVWSLSELGFHEVGVSPARTGPAPELALSGGDWAAFLSEMKRAADDEIARVRVSGAPLRFGNLGVALKEIHRGACRPLPCGAGHGYVSLSADGRYYTCHRTVGDERFSVGDAASGPDLAARQRFLRAAAVDRQESCRTCWARYLCGGGCHAEVAAAGRAGCEYVRGWLDHCLRTYDMVAREMPHLLSIAWKGSHEE
jgi:uncharacterized protein